MLLQNFKLPVECDCFSVEVFQSIKCVLVRETATENGGEIALIVSILRRVFAKKNVVVGNTKYRNDSCFIVMFFSQKMAKFRQIMITVQTLCFIKSTMKLHEVNIF